MVILHVTKRYPDAIGGDATYVSNLEIQQKNAGHQVFVLTTNCKEIINKQNLYKFGLKDSSNNWDSITFKRLISSLSLLFYLPVILNKIKPDVVHVHACELGFLSSTWAKIFKIPLILTCHFVAGHYRYENKLKRILEFLFIKFSCFNKIITVDSGSLEYFKKNNFKNYLFLPPGVDLEIFQVKDKKISLGSNKKIKFLFVGRLDIIKGIDYLLEAARLLLEKDNNFEIIIVGDGFHGDKLRQDSRKLNLEACVNFRGAISDRDALSEIYNSSDVFILPSIVEAFGIVILEAWAANLAVITTVTVGISKICTHLENAFLIPSQDSHALFEAMLALMQDDKLRKKIASNGNILAKNEFSWTVINQKLEAVYRQAQKE